MGSHIPGYSVNSEFYVIVFKGPLIEYYYNIRDTKLNFKYFTYHTFRKRWMNCHIKFCGYILEFEKYNAITFHNDIYWKAFLAGLICILFLCVLTTFFRSYDEIRTLVLKEIFYLLLMWIYPLSPNSTPLKFWMQDKCSNFWPALIT